MATEEKTINVVGMHCPSCVAAVELSRKDLDGVEDAKADLMESIRILKEEIGKDNALLYPDCLDSDCQETVTSDNAVFASPGSL